MAALLLVALLFVRERDLPQAPPISPFHYLDERKAAIYENLRDLQFEYRVGKLSDADYRQTKLDLQKELAQVLAEVDRVKAELQLTPTVAPAPVKSAKGARGAAASTCPACGAQFAQALKFCGECGAPMSTARGNA